MDRPSALRLPLASPAARALAALPERTWEQPPDVTIRPLPFKDPLSEDMSGALEVTLCASDATAAAPDAADAAGQAPHAGSLPQPRHASPANPPADLRADLHADLQWLPRLSISARPHSPDTSGAFGSAASDFELIDELGSGGMGVVWRAHQRTLRREVAIKRAKIALHGAGALLHEARITGGLEHPHIIPVHALGLDQQQHPVLVMKRVEGVVWRALIQDPTHPWWPRLAPGPDRLAWHLERLIQVSDAIAFAHERGVIHRDIKPDNVMIGAFGEVYMLDWGVALATDPNPADPASDTHQAPAKPRGGFSFVGTPAYMAPEMISGDAPITARSDVYLLGATLYEILTGRPPHSGASVLDVLRSACLGGVPPLSPAQAHPALAEVCARAMRADPAERYPSAQAFKQALRGYLHRRAALRLVERAEGLLRSLTVALSSPQGAPSIPPTRSPDAPPDPSPDTSADASADASPDTTPDTPEAAQAQAQRLFIECRFALQQALSEDPTDAAALDALERALTLMIDAELRADHVTAARALLADLPRPSPTLTARVEAAEARAAHARAELDALRAIAHGMDRAVSSTQRGALMSGLALFWGALVVGAVASIRLFDYAPDYPEALGAAIGGLLMALGGMYAFRASFRDHRLNRLVMVIVSTIIATATLLRALLWHLGLPVLTALNVELVTVALATLVGAITLDKRLVPPALLCMACGVCGALAPAVSPEAYAVGQFGALFWISRVWLTPHAAQERP